MKYSADKTGMAQSHILQVVNGDGEFDETRVSDFLASHSINDVGVGYQVVAITGPQSSGKSTLMNAVVSLLANIDDRIHFVVLRTCKLFVPPRAS